MRRLLLGLVIVGLLQCGGITVKRGPGFAGAGASANLGIDTTCLGLWAYSTTDMVGSLTTVNDQCRVQGMNVMDTLVTTPTANTSVPGTWGPSGTDPRRSVNVVGNEAIYGTDTGDLFAPTGANITVCAWYNRDATSATDDTIFAKARAATNVNEVRLMVDEAATDVAQIQIGGTTLAGTTAIPASTWTHICARYTESGDAGEIFLNGVTEATGTVGDLGAATTGGRISIGAGGSATTDTPADGLIHEVGYWQCLLAPQDICAICRCGALDEVQDRTALCNGCAMRTGASCTY